MATAYILKSIRTLLIEGFTDEDLRRFCYDDFDFRPVYNQLAVNTGKAGIVDRLIEYAEQKRLIEELLAWAEKHNPARYKEGEPYIETITSSSSLSSSIPQRENHHTLVEPVEQSLAVPVDFLIITPLEEERDALLKQLPNYKKLDPVDNDIHVYFEADLPVTSANGSYRLIVMPLLGMGRAQAATAANDAIRRWNPRYIILVGIAGGVATNNVRLGDIIIPDKIIDYELQKQTSEEIDIRWEVYNVNRRLLGAAKNLLSENWSNLIQVKRPQRGQPRRHIGPIASGDKVIDFAQTLDKYRATWSKLIGVEMEAGGVALSTLQTEKQTEFFMIRGVSDLADGNKNALYVQKWRSYACEAAASYTMALLQSKPVTLERRTPPTRKVSLYQLCLWEQGICTKKLPLKSGETYLIGRSEICQFWIPGKYDEVSRRHARIKLTKDEVILLDGDGATSSEHGTFVNGVSVDNKQGTILSHGDKIVLGRFIDKEKQIISEQSCLLTFEQQL